MEQEAIKFTKAWGASDVDLLEAMSTHEILSSVVFTFLKTDATGKASTLQTVPPKAGNVLGDGIQAAR